MFSELRGFGSAKVYSGFGKEIAQISTGGKTNIYKFLTATQHLKISTQNLTERFFSYNRTPGRELIEPYNVRRFDEFYEKYQKKSVIEKEFSKELKITKDHLNTIYHNALRFEALKKPTPSIESKGEDASLAGTEIHDYRQELISHYVEKEQGKKKHTAEEERQHLSYLNTGNTENNAENYIMGRFGKKANTESIPEVETGILFSPEFPLNDVYDASQKYIKHSSHFNDRLNTVLKSGSSNGEKIQALQHFLYDGVSTKNGEKIKGDERFNSYELKAIYMKFWELNAHDQMVEMMDNCENRHFLTDPLNLLFYARAILKGHYFNLHNAGAVAKLLMENPNSRSEGLALQGIIHSMAKRGARRMLDALDSNNVTDEIKKEYQELFLDAIIDRENVLENYYSSLSQAIVNFEEAFTETWDCRYGCRLMHLLLEQKSPERAQYVARLTQLAAQKEGGLKSNNFAVARAYLETLYILPESSPKEIEMAENVLLSLCTNLNQVKNAYEGIIELNIEGKESNLGMQTEHRKHFINTLKVHFFELENDPEYALSVLKNLKQTVKEALNEWDRFTFSYKSLYSNYIPGNFQFGAQLPAHNINRYDRKFFEEILKATLKKLFDSPEKAQVAAKNLMKIKSFEEFDKVVNSLIREKFHTDEWHLERLDSDGHKIFDASVQGLLALSGAPTNEIRKLIPDSRTNISTNFIIGLGDCRHHTQVKQILFDIWQGSQLDKIMKKIHRAEAKGDQEAMKALTLQFNEIKAQQLRTFDCEVYLPIEIKDGFPVWHEGHLVKNSSGNPIKVEEHTLNVQMNFNPKTDQLEQVRLRDSFYQSTYPWKDCEIQLQSKNLKEGIQASSIEIYNPSTGKLETVPIFIKPTSYAGARERYDRGNNDNRFIGQPVKTLSLAEALAQRSQMKRYLQRVRNWHQHMASQSTKES